MAMYTSGEWRAKQGREKEFVEAWHDLAEWTGREFDWDGWAKLLRDKDDPSHFRSIGEWPDGQMIERWRASEGFKQRTAKIKELTTDMKVSSMELAAEVVAKARAV